MADSRLVVKVEVDTSELDAALEKAKQYADMQRTPTSAGLLGWLGVASVAGKSQAKLTRRSLFGWLLRKGRG